MEDLGLGEQLKLYRIRRNISLSDLERKSGVKRYLLEKMEDEGKFDTKHLRHVKKALRVEVRLIPITGEL